jgi:hypothetical protein
MSIVLRLATAWMPLSFVQFGYKCDSCELLAFGYSWVTQEEISPGE